jgi:hypothetical protein
MKLKFNDVMSQSMLSRTSEMALPSSFTLVWKQIGADRKILNVLTGM